MTTKPLENKKPDRRVLRTRSLLQDALVALILEVGYKKITVQNIIDRANIGRSTFYDHFLDKEDLLSSSFNQMAHDLTQQFAVPHDHKHGHDHVIHSLDFFRHADLNRTLYRAMAESGGRDIWLRIGREHMHGNIRLHLKELNFDQKDLAVPIPILTQVLANSLLAMITWWLEEKETYSAEEMNKMYNTLVMPGFWKLIETPSP